LHSGLSAIAADELLVAERKRLKAEGAELLGSRCRDTYRHGGGLPKAVLDERGDWFPSLTEAARARGIALSTAAKRIRNGDWDYIL
jgi:hypothetical protein